MAAGFIEHWYPRAVGIEIHAKVVRISDEHRSLARRVNGTRAGRVRVCAHERTRVDFYQETTAAAVAVAAKIRKFRGMSVFCPCDYVAAEVNPYPAWIVGREVKSIAGGNGERVGRGTMAKAENRGGGRGRGREGGSQVKITRRDTPRRRNSNEPRD